MAESDRAPQIQFEIDQEIFIDSVFEGDVVEDATVATEVTLFDRVGDAYVLEGAIVFAGYTKGHEDTEDESEGPGVDALSLTLGTGNVRHFHHRLPFVLRVPVKAQPRGIVNVNSRISSWRLEVVGSGWIRILGDLTVLGLNSSAGYHFQCGAQEEGDLLFQSSFSDVEGYEQEVHEVQDWHPDDNSQGSEASESLELVRQADEETQFQQAFDGTSGQSDHDVSHAANHQDTDVISFARGGQQDQSTSDEPRESSTNEKTPEDDFSGNELQRLDRLFGVKDEPHHEDSADSRGIREDTHEKAVENDGESRKAASAAPNSDAVETRENVVEFDFEHQVADVTEMSNQDTGDLSIGEDLQEHARRAPEVVMGEQTSVAETDERGESVPKTSADMWSFVDFNQPDTTYTLRYVIVMEEESVEAISERLECSREALMRLNHLSPDALVRPGQPLAVPEQNAT